MPSIEAAYLAEAYIHYVLFACDIGGPISMRTKSSGFPRRRWPFSSRVDGRQSSFARRPKL